MRRLTINGASSRHKKVAEEIEAVYYTTYASPTELRVVASPLRGAGHDVCLTMCKEEAIDLAIDILKQAQRLRESTLPKEK